MWKNALTGIIPRPSAFVKRFDKVRRGGYDGTELFAAERTVLIMAQIYTDITQLVGGTPLLRLDRLLQRRAAKENGAFYPTTKQQLRYS